MLTMHDIIEGKVPDGPDEWEQIYKEYCTFQDIRFNHKYPSRDRDIEQAMDRFREDFLLTTVGHELQLQWLDSRKEWDETAFKTLYCK